MANYPRDENSAPGQADANAAVPDAHLAKGVPGAEPPPEGKAPRAGKRDRAAAGFSSIWETVHRGARDMGVKRSLKTLLTINQKDGFDCPSCAWPDPDGERKTAEFCENGAKAVASEATRARVTPEFFAAAPDLRPAGAQRLLARPAGAPHASHGAPTRAPITTSRSPGTTRSR